MGLRVAIIATLVLARGAAEYSLGVRDSLMIAHSFKGSEFGPAQRLHGATYTCDVAFCARKLRPGLNWVLDIGQASEIVAAVLKEYHLHNLDELFPEENTTTEWMCAKEGGGRPDARQPPAPHFGECRRPGARKSGGTSRRPCLEELAYAAYASLCTRATRRKRPSSDPCALGDVSCRHLATARCQWSPLSTAIAARPGASLQRPRSRATDPRSGAGFRAL